MSEDNMPSELLVMDGVALAAGAVGLGLLLRPRAVRGFLALPDGDGATYAIRIVGAMLTALALFLGGFATMFWLASGGGA